MSSEFLGELVKAPRVATGIGAAFGSASDRL